jgi:outer membrane protein OmpA-like peptidoglycan-associated protein
MKTRALGYALLLALSGGCLPPVQPSPLYPTTPAPAQPPPLVEVTQTHLVLSQAIFFEFDRDRILPVSYPILDEVARALQAHPELVRVRIEGHTDNRGTPSYNLNLSQRRAQAVLAYLQKKGVAEGRLLSVGLGQGQPIADNASEEGRAQNRRVVFVIEERQDVPGIRQARR